MKPLLMVMVLLAVFFASMPGCEATDSGGNGSTLPENSDPDIKGPAIVQGGQTGSIGESPPAYLTLREMTPADGEVDVPRDAPIVVFVDAFSDVSCFVNYFVARQIRVTVIESESGAAIDGETVNWLIGNEVGGSDTVTDKQNAEGPPGDFSAVWRPAEPLKPNTEYYVEVEVDNSEYANFTGYDAPDVQGPLALQARFTTSEAELPPFTLEDDPSVEYFGYDAEVLECDSWECGTCRPTGSTRPAVFARVRFGSLSGGWEAHPYSARLWLTDNTPNRFSDPSDDHDQHEVVSGTLAWIDAGHGFDMSIVIPAEDWIYTPCFAFELSDASGQNIEPEPTCAEVPPSIDWQ